MKKNLLVKLVAVFVIILLVVNTVLMVFGLINLVVFWIVIALSALIAYKGLPYLNKALKP
tara:strand:+ start:258 stop:437 length:180 start_codon:yes stop_codon:yes gene_type:complete